jgi:hypothetical protein
MRGIAKTVKYPTKATAVIAATAALVFGLSAAPAFAAANPPAPA